MHKLTFTYTTIEPENVFGKYETVKVSYRFDTIDENDYVSYNDRPPVDISEGYISHNGKDHEYTEYYFGIVDEKEVAIYTSESRKALCTLINQTVEDMSSLELVAA